MELVLETLPGGTRLYTGAAHPITTDSLLLAAFCPAGKRFSLCDLGAGNGILLFSLLDKGVCGPARAVEREPAAAGVTPGRAVAGALREAVAAGGPSSGS